MLSEGLSEVNPMWCGVTTVFRSLTQEDQPGLNARTCLDKEINETIRNQGRSQEYIKCHFFLMDKKTWQ